MKKVVVPIADSFRFDPTRHEYTTLDGEVRPHITGMLERTGWVDDTWMTEESSERGRAVHKLTADYDLHALDVATCVSRYKGYLLGYAAAVPCLRAKWTAIEEPAMHSRFLFGGRPDRSGLALEHHAIGEIKSGVRSLAHQIQTALQAILEADRHPLPAEAWLRIAIYLKPNGRFTVERHTSRRDFDEAYRIIKRCC